MIWIIGSKTMLGREITSKLTEQKLPWIGSNEDVDIRDATSLDTFALSHDRDAGRTGNAVTKGKVPGKITWIINLCDYNDFYEAEKNPEKAKQYNENGARNIARTARHIGAKLIHISSAHVYEGDETTPYDEESTGLPSSVIGKTKLKGEEAIAKEMTQYYILRTSYLYGLMGNNPVYQMINEMKSNPKVTAINNMWISPTSAQDLGSCIAKIISTSENASSLFGKKAALPYGIYNYSNIGKITMYDWCGKIYDFAKAYKRITSDCEIVPCNRSEKVSDVKLPFNTSLNTEKIQKSLKIKIPKWEDSLEKFIKNQYFDPDFE